MTSLSSLIAPSFYGTHNKIKRGEITEALEQGGRGSTKSSFLSIEVVLQLILHPECHAVVFRKVGNTLRRSVYAQICWAINALGVNRDFRCTVSPMECTYKPTGQKIIFLGLDDPGKAKSIKLPFGYIGIAWFEELDQYAGPEEIRNVEQSVLRGGAFSLTLKSFNPPAASRNWANRYAREAKDGKNIHHSTYKTVPPEWLGPRFLADAEYLREHNPTAYRNEYEGEVTGSGTQVFDNVRLETITDRHIGEFERIYHGVDWGWYPDPYAWNRMSYDAARKTLYVYDEITRLKTSNAETARILLQEKKMGKGDSLVADSAEQKSIDDYRSAGLPCRPVEKGPGSVAYRMKWLQSLHAIVIDPARCPDTAKEFSEYEYEQDKKTGEILPGYPDVDNHHIDSVSYGLFPVWRRRGQ